MARDELAERHAFSYPPYSRLIQLTLRDDDPARLRRQAGRLAELLRERFGRRVIGPVAPPVDRIRGLYILRILLNIENCRPMSRARELLREALAAAAREQEWKHINAAVDVDVQ